VLPRALGGTREVFRRGTVSFAAASLTARGALVSGARLRGHNFELECWP
jgi:hypothetical protein